MTPDELAPSPSATRVVTSVTDRPSSVRARAELDALRERLMLAQRVFDDYTAARVARRREAELARARLLREAALGSTDVES